MFAVLCTLPLLGSFRLSSSLLSVGQFSLMIVDVGSVGSKLVIKVVRVRVIKWGEGAGVIYVTISL